MVALIAEDPSMKRFQRLLVALALKEREDDCALRFADLIGRLAGSEKVYALHVVRSLDIPDAVLKHHPELAQPVDETARDRIEGMIRRCLPDSKLPFELDVSAGTPLREIVRRAMQKNVDLLIIGRRPGEGIVLPDKILRKSPCSVLAAPVGSQLPIKRILVPVDMSSHSKEAVEYGIAFAVALGLPSIRCFHSYSVPIGYHKLGKTYEEFAEIMKRSAEEEFVEMMRTVDPRGVRVEPTFRLHEKPSAAICEGIESSKADLVIMGARGRTVGSGLLLGSVTEKVFRTVRVPMLAVRHRGESLSLLQALFGA
jgi:nucleotide-binding universal stress UspA family protein